MSNIFELQQELLDLFDEVEQNYGELTPELEEKLAITQDEFLEKVEKYTCVIKDLNIEMAGIKEEQARLKALYDRKEKTVNNLKKIIINAVNQFGATKKSGVKYLNYGLGEVSVRKSEAVEINEDLVKAVETELINGATFNKEINQLDCSDHVDLTSFVKKYSNDNNVAVTTSELNNVDVNLSVTIPISDLSKGTGYPALKEIIRYSDNYKLSTSVSKSALKPKLKENGACVPNLAKLVQNESLIIK